MGHFFGHSGIPEGYFLIIGLFWLLFIYAQIAQLVEQRTENPRVAGSIPALGIFCCSFLFPIYFDITKHGSIGCRAHIFVLLKKFTEI